MYQGRQIVTRMDLHEDAENNYVTATFGVEREHTSPGPLRLQSEEHNENGYAVQELLYGKYSKTLQLPQGVKVRLQKSRFL